MKIPSGSISALQLPPAAEARRARETLAGGTESERTARDDAAGTGAARTRASSPLASPARVQRMDAADNATGPGRQALSAYLAVARNSVPDAFEAQLAGIDILV